MDESLRSVSLSRHITGGRLTGPLSSGCVSKINREINYLITEQWIRQTMIHISLCTWVDVRRDSMLWEIFVIKSQTNFSVIYNQCLSKYFLIEKSILLYIRMGENFSTKNGFPSIRRVFFSISFMFRTLFFLHQNSVNQYSEDFHPCIRLNHSEIYLHTTYFL